MFVSDFCAGFVGGILASVQFEGRANSSKCNFNRLHSDASAIGKLAFSNSICENFQGGNLLGCGLVGEPWVHVIERALGDPMVPEAFPFVVTCRHDATEDGFVNSTAMILEITAPFRWNSRQD